MLRAAVAGSTTLTGLAREAPAIGMQRGAYLVNESATMRAVVLTGHGGLDRLEYREDVPRPEPGTAEVRIRVGATAVNNTDINTRTAWYVEEVTRVGPGASMRRRASPLGGRVRRSISRAFRVRTCAGESMPWARASMRAASANA
jgi:hypothetical protein